MLMHTYYSQNYAGIIYLLLVMRLNKKKQNKTKKKNTIIPLHSASLGSGSHFPFAIHVVELGPVKTYSEIQSKLRTVPSTAGSM